MITNINQYKLFLEKKNEQLDLIIVDVQEGYKEYFNDTYLEELKKYCLDFNRIFQIWDSKDDTKPDYTFPNETLAIEKQYGKKLSIDEVPYYFHSSEHETIINKLKNIPDENDVFETIHGDYWIYIDAQRNAQKGHEWFFCNRKLSEFFKDLKKQNRKTILVGGAAGECLLDVYKAMRIFGIDVMYNSKYVYSAKGSNFPDVKKVDKEDKEDK